ncbi:helix-turn-helix transcriptional regulator [Aquabacterium sp.]|jgi:AraC-like DNA-binding protein|uniref:helix-turn-helix transcriptional regulator n=1 Tax=Aquabacterium sp. TaxID=1872578 RepID=UPI003BAFD265
MPRLPLRDPATRHLRFERTPMPVAAMTADDERTVAQWAEPLGLTARTVHRLFAANTGMTFGQWRQQARLLAGLEQLAQGEKVAHVALAAGYRSQSAFAAMFKRHFGIAPTAFFDTPSGG